MSGDTYWKTVIWIARVAVVALVCTTFRVAQGILVDERDLAITEGATRQVFIRRELSSSPLSLTVLVTTIAGYKQHLQTPLEGCNNSLSSLGVNESLVDPAEDGDLSGRMYLLQYMGSESEASFMLEVVDDNIAENEETFILYTNTTESSDDECAVAVTIRDDDFVWFNFSKEIVDISEGHCLPCELSIVKEGEAEPNIDVRVVITPTSGNLDANDFIANMDYIYTFTSDTTDLQIETRLFDDRLAESLESFIICLDSISLPNRARTSNPSCVTVNVYDDDSVSVGFTNKSVTLREGGLTKTLCVDMKTGLDLDPHDIVTLVMVPVPQELGTEIEFGNEQLSITQSDNTACRTVTANNNDISDGTRNFMIEVRSDGIATTTVPVQFNPMSVTVSVIDNDVTSFELSINEDAIGHDISEPLSLVEGNSIDNLLTLAKTGRSRFTYTVNLIVMALTDTSDPSDLILDRNIQFDISDSEVDSLNVPIQIPEDLLPEKKKQFSIMIGSIMADDSNGNRANGTLTTVQGGSIVITVYDNDFNVSFMNGTRVPVAEGSSSLVCVSIFGIEPSDLNPEIMILLQISVHNQSAESGFLNVSSSQITLSSTNHIACFNATFPVDNEVCDGELGRSFVLQLTWTHGDQYTVNIHQQNLTVFIDDAQDCVSPSNAAAIAVPIVFILALIGCIVAALLIVWLWKRRNHRYYPKHLEKINLEHSNKDIVK